MSTIHLQALVRLLSDDAPEGLETEYWSDERDKLKKEFLKEIQVGVEYKVPGEDHYHIILEDMAEPGKYRIQSFDDIGFYHHITFDTLDEAKKALAYEFMGGEKLEPVPGILDQLAVTPTWKETLRYMYPGAMKHLEATLYMLCQLVS